MNTATKRFSAIHIALPFRGVANIPSGTLNKAATAFFYGGFEFTPGADVVHHGPYMMANMGTLLMRM